MCRAAGALASRRTGSNALVLRTMLEACAETCRLCAAECARHAGKHRHREICAEACQRCAEACGRAAATITPSHR